MLASAEGKFTISEVIGTSPIYPEAYNWNVQTGRFISPDDMANDAKVCVIGTKIWDNLFGKEKIAGKEIVLNNQRFRIVGIMEEAGTLFLPPTYKTAIGFAIILVVLLVKPTGLAGSRS